MVTQHNVRWGFVTDATSHGVGGLTGSDFGFLPEQRHDPLRAAVWRGDDLRLISLLLSDDRAAFAATAQGASGQNILGLEPDTYTIQTLLDSARDEWEEPRVDGSERTRFEWRQDLWRSVGDWGQAAKVTEQWTTFLPDDGFGWDRRGEVAFLAGDYATAIRYFTQAVPLLEAVDYGEDPTWEQLSGPQAAALARLKVGAAQEALGQPARAEEAYRSVTPTLVKEEFYATSQLGLLLLKQKRFVEAAVVLRQSVAVSEEQDGEYWKNENETMVFFLKGAQENNLALALIENGEAVEAVPFAEGALSRDGANPIFLDTLAYAYSRAGDVQKARGAYATAFEADKTNYLAHNNLGVILGEAGEHAAAKEQFLQAVTVNPKYAIAWKNLGVALGHTPGGSFLGVQAAFREAAANERAYRGAGLGYELDTNIYDSGFDVSRTLRPDWSIGGSSKRQPVGLTLAAVVLSLIVAARVFITDELGGRFAGWLSDRSKRPGWRRLLRRRLPAWLVLVAGPLVMAVSFWREGRFLGEILGLTLFTLAAVSSTVLLRWATVRLRAYAWAPSFVATGVLLPFGVVFAPTPCGLAARGWRRWAPTVLLAAMSTVLLLAAIFVPAPIVRFSAIVAVTLTACLLLPVRPHDGGFLPKKWWTILIALPLALSALALGQNWI